MVLASQPETFARLARLQQRPSRWAVMHQRWRSLCFFHRPLAPAIIQDLLPAGLRVQTFPDETGEPMAWLGFVPFRMEGIRVRPLPPIYGLRRFPETNLRTYVETEDGEPGVWFFSLDATNRVAVQVARRGFGLNYVQASMKFTETPQSWTFSGVRQRSEAAYSGHVTLGNDVPSAAVPGTFEFWLVERYRLFTLLKGHLLSGRIHHAPYQLERVVESAVEETLSPEHGLPAARPGDYSHVLVSRGVNVEVFALESVTPGRI